MKTKTYKAIMVPEELHHEIKKLALNKKLTMIEYLELLLKR